jgi:hypothetical protein
VADDIVLNVGVGGATIGADLIGGVDYQRIKLIAGADGVNDGDVAKGNPLPTKQTGATATTANVAANAASVTVLASNASRLRAWLYNDADKSAYVKFGAGATTASFTKKLLPNEFFPVEFYTGVLDAIWDAGPTGSMRVTELAP